jgi:carboxypeptidase PM20D1
MIRTALITLILLLCGSAAYSQSSSADYTADYQRTALEIYRHIISIRSAAGHGNVPEVANYLADRFRDGGFDDADIHVLPQTLSSGEETASLVVRYEGNDSSGREPILLIAHMDVVDALPTDWERDPFTLVEEDGYFFGRGTLDDKFGITTLSTTFLRLKAAGFVPNRDLILGFTGDEESGMETTRALATEYRELTDAEYVLNADGGGGFLDHDGKAIAYLIQAAEKTFASFELTIRNPGGHSSLPRPDNAIYELATVLKNIEAYTFPTQINDITRGYFEKSAAVTAAPVGDAMRRFAANPHDEEALAVLGQYPEHYSVTRTTCVATMLSAGHAENALPQSATATVNCRIFPGVAVEDVRAKLFEVGAIDTLEIKIMGEPASSPASPINEEVNAAVTNAVHKQHPDIPIIPYMSPYGTDGKIMRRAGMPTYGVMGLFFRPEDEFAHGLNERVQVDAFFGALEYWHDMLTDLAGN